MDCAPAPAKYPGSETLIPPHLVVLFSLSDFDAAKLDYLDSLAKTTHHPVR